MADIHTARLCVHIINSHFGPLVAKVSETLLNRGRLPLSFIVRQTALKPRTVRAAIIILIQHGVLWHNTSDEEGEIFEFNAENCLIRLRFGWFVYLAEKLHGPVGGHIVQLILDNGKLRPPQLFSLLPNDMTADHMDYKQAFLKLARLQYLVAATQSYHISPRDAVMRLEKEELGKISGLPTSKELINAKAVAAARLKQAGDDAEKIGIKRKAGNDLLDDSVHFRVNYDKFNVHIRNELLERAAGERFNHGAALVLRGVLKACEATQKSLSQSRSDSISLGKVTSAVGDTDQLAQGLHLNTKHASNIACVKHYLGLLSSADNPTPSGRTSSFVTFSANKIEVEFEIACRRLRRRVFEAFTREKYGIEGLRILRLLLDSGKLDEKQISKVVMMPGKDVRPLLTSMASDSFVSIQEVPRSADRNPTRTFYLWYIDQRKAYSVILGSLYKTQYNIAVRRQAEGEDPTLKAVLEKTQRTDVSQDESLLTRLDQEILAAWRERLDKLTILSLRVEESVFVIRDLAVHGVDED